MKRAALLLARAFMALLLAWGTWAATGAVLDHLSAFFGRRSSAGEVLETLLACLSPMLFGFVYFAGL